MAATEEQKAYLAGLIDGEGCIELAFNNRKDGYKQYYPRVRIHMTNLEALEAAKDLYGGSITTRKPYKNHWKQAYDWGISCGKAVTLLKDIFPYSIIKKEEITLLLSFETTDKPRCTGLSEEKMKSREFIHNELKRLKTL